MRIVIVYEIPDEVDPDLTDPHELADALTNLDHHYLGRHPGTRERFKPEFIGAEWEDNARLVTLDALLKGES